ncbi:hypothetical protein, partial [Leclercia adecarboxylata]|uniref:hypothetical protein n=1 Tax=Leclercia adecarboxylata TaxID=83655 RepID=UPI00234C2FFA
MNENDYSRWSAKGNLGDGDGEANAQDANQTGELHAHNTGHEAGAVGNPDTNPTDRYRYGQPLD